MDLLREMLDPIALLLVHWPKYMASEDTCVLAHFISEKLFFFFQVGKCVQMYRNHNFLF